MFFDEEAVGKGEKILYIEDNPGNRLLVQRILLVEDFVVIEAEDGATGIEYAVKEKPDLILMDMNLPETDGYQLTQKIRAIPEIADIPIIAMTANVMMGDKEKTLEAGCNGYIPKPIDVDALPRQVREYLDARGK